jgi:hypothetical protein
VAGEKGHCVASNGAASNGTEWAQRST